MNRSELKQLITEEIFQFMKEEDFGIDPHKDYGSHATGKTFIDLLGQLKKLMSTEAFDIVLNFAKSATGWNRSMILEKLVDLYTSKVPYIKRDVLISYLNKDLLKLINTGELEEVKMGNTRFVRLAKNTPSTDSINTIQEIGNKLKSLYHLLSSDVILAKAEKIAQLPKNELDEFMKSIDVVKKYL